MKIDMIGFDADDTLWYTEIHYIKAQEAVKKLLHPWGTDETIAQVIDRAILDNLARYGYGIKAFILSLIEAAIHASGGEIRGEQIEQILSIGKSMLAAEIVLRPHVAETLCKLAPTFPMMIITKGDLLDQTTKVKRSGIANYFSAVEIVNDKTEEAYTRLFEKYDINPRNFLMIGNTIRSDIQPVLALGGTAVHIPAESTWAHETSQGFNTAQNGFYELAHMGELTELVARINHAD